MNLSDYVDAARGRQTALAIGLGAQPQLVWQWARKIRPVPIERCAPIEQATDRAVRRWDLRPDDWHIHWPELIGTEGAPPVAPAGEPVPESTAGASVAWPPLPSITPVFTGTRPGQSTAAGG